ncbi:MAG: hypothetical protein K2G70_03975, partial [Turicibacter sp.]|nr:hypothetical protein [Turicibacter sp.]
MTKRKIFDIEKIGFGDEEIISPPQKPVLKNEPFVQSTVKPRVQPVVNRPPAILSNEVTIKQENNYSTPTKRQPSRVSTPSPTTNSGYKPVEFVSPISGRRVNQPKTVHLAHGQYYFATASMVDEKLDQLKDEELQLEKQLVDEEHCVLHSNDKNEEIKSEDEVCPSFTTTNDAGKLQQNETTTMPILSDESEDFHVVAIDETLHEEDDVQENDEGIASHKEEVNISPDRTEKDLELTGSHSSLEVKDLSHPVHLASKSSQQELDFDGVLSLLDEEEKSPSIFDALLEESTKSQTLNQEHGLDDVMNLLQEEENQTSIFDQILNQSEQTDTTEVDVFIEEVFDDENFCNEVLEQVQTESADDEAVYYEMPPLNLLKDPLNSEQLDEEWIVSKMETLEQTFLDFGVKVRLTGEYTQGPTVTQIEIQPESGTKLNKIMNLSDDLKLSLSVEELRIEPISGKNTIGVEIPNPKRKMVCLKEILSKHDFMFNESPLYIGLGQDVAGQPVYADILTMPHGLIAGQTGSGKSVCINSLLVSVLYKASPEDVRLMLIDPKRVELAPYNSIPHLITPVICDERKAAQGLKWAVEEMERRYELFATNGVRDIKSFN